MGGIGVKENCDFVGFPQVIPEGIEMLRPGGTYLEIGTISRGAKVELEPATLVWGAKKIVGVIMYEASVIPRALDFLVRNQARFPFDRLISHTYPLDKINQAFSDSEWHNRETTKISRPDRLMDTAERRFRDLVHGVDAIVWEADAASLACTFVSQRAEDLLGYPIERWLGATAFWGEIVDARDRHRVLARYGEALTAERPLEHEFRVTTADGRQVWLRDRVHPADRGRLRGIMIDVTEHRRLQAERDELLLREQVARNEMESAAEMVQRLETITEAALSDLSQEHLLRRVLERIRDVLEADGALILLPTEDGEGLRVMGAVGLELEDDVRVPMDDSLSGRIARSRRAVLVEDAGRTDPDIPALWRAHVRSLVGVPLSVDGHSVGVVHAVRLARRRFSADDARLLQLVGDRLGVAIPNARLYAAQRRARLALEAATQRAAVLADAGTAPAAAPRPPHGPADR